MMSKTTPNLTDLRQSVADFYEKRGADFARTRLGHWSGFNLIKPFLQSGKLVVDVGAGNGRLAAYLPEDVPYLGIEPSLSYRETALHETLLIPGGLPELPIHDEISYTTCCFAVFQHIPPEDLERCRDELMRITAPGGYLIVTSWLPSFEDMVPVDGRTGSERWIPWKAGEEIDMRYVHCPTLETWNQLWTMGGHEIIQSGYIEEQGWTEIKEHARNLCVILKKN
ncbi:class I SAM-dependent methyltransferase [Candidatus Uhrbacteria bacterium]|nr:class I SAM-dependent methyltransferase [Candidatus Uhrbacteria bacterium]